MPVYCPKSTRFNFVHPPSVWDYIKYLLKIQSGSSFASPWYAPYKTPLELQRNSSRLAIRDFPYRDPCWFCSIAWFFSKSIDVTSFIIASRVILTLDVRFPVFSLLLSATFCTAHLLTSRLQKKTEWIVWHKNCQILNLHSSLVWIATFKSLGYCWVGS